MIKWIISDMDGTLLVEPNKLPDDFDEIMDLLKQHNIMFSPASGRQYQALVSQFPKYKDDLLFISENGLMSANMIKKFFLLHYQILLYKKLSLKLQNYQK